MLMARRCVIDTNWLSNAQLEDYLSRSALNHAVIAEMTLVEVHKKAASYSARLSMRTLCKFPRQVSILRSTRELYRDGGVSKGLADRLTEARQTASFGEYCRTVIEAPDDNLLDDHFAKMEEQSRDQIADLRADVSNILVLFGRLATIFDNSELDSLRKRIPYSEGLQRKLIQLSMDMHKMLLRSLNIESQYHPKSVRRTLDTFVFRYALCVVLFLTRWIRHGESMEIKEERLINHIMDLKTAAVASFFDGLKTEDALPRDVHLEAKHILGAIGAYVNCGKGPSK